MPGPNRLLCKGMVQISPLSTLTGVVITRNEADRIERCVRSLAAVCGEVIVVDSGSTDRTCELARNSGARVIERGWPGFAAQKNFAIAAAATPWVLLLDADEWLTEELQTEIAEVFASSRVESCDAWSIHRQNHFMGKAIRHGGWGRERVVRLMRNDVRYRDMRVHEELELDGRKVGRLRSSMGHETYRDLDDYRNKLQRYAELFAEDRHARGKRARLHDLAFRPAFYFVKNYLLRGGFLDGKPGYVLDREYARYVYAKYAHLRSLNSRES